MAKRSTLRLPGAMVLGGDWDIGMGVREFGEALAESLSGRRRPWQLKVCQLQIAAADQQRYGVHGLARCFRIDATAWPFDAGNVKATSTSM